jgi:hypothetical protein
LRTSGIGEEQRNKKPYWKALPYPIDDNVAFVVIVKRQAQARPEVDLGRNRRWCGSLNSVTLSCNQSHVWGVSRGNHLDHLPSKYNNKNTAISFSKM